MLKFVDDDDDDHDDKHTLIVENSNIRTTLISQYKHQSLCSLENINTVARKTRLCELIACCNTQQTDKHSQIAVVALHKDRDKTQTIETIRWNYQQFINLCRNIFKFHSNEPCYIHANITDDVGTDWR